MMMVAAKTTAATTRERQRWLRGRCMTDDETELRAFLPCVAGWLALGLASSGDRPMLFRVLV